MVFISETLDRFRTEADVVVMGLKLLNDLTVELAHEIDKVPCCDTTIIT
jgi:hypothetical protein